jgi:hypothetical protein
MKFNIGDHLQEIDSIHHGIVVHFNCEYKNSNDVNWYLLESDEMELINHWVPEYKLELHKQPLRESKLNQLGI